ncbi:hypothetical protein M9458_043407, partial [Cirrhinus mrigala]
NAELKTVYAVETNSTFLECIPRSPQATIKWIIQPNHSQTSIEVRPHPVDSIMKNLQINRYTSNLNFSISQLVPGEENLIHMQRGLLLQHLASANAGLYLCVAYEHSFSRTLARYELHVIPQNHMLKAQNTHPGNYIASPRSYKELHLMGVNGLTADEYCEHLWFREKRQKQKLRPLKWKLGGKIHPTSLSTE